MTWLRRSGLLTFELGLLLQIIYIVLSYRLTIQYHLQCPRPKSFALWRILHDSFRVLCVISVQWPTIRTVNCGQTFALVSCSWAHNRRNGVRFPKHPQNVSRSFRCSGPTFHFWTRLLTSFIVELGLTGPTSISGYVLTTRPESLSSYQSNDSALSVRPRIL